MPDEGAGTSGRGATTGRERGIMRMGWTGTTVMATAGWIDGGTKRQRDEKMAGKMAKERVRRRGCT